MRDNQQMLIEKAIEFKNVRDALLDTLEQAPSEERDRQVAELTARKDQLLQAVMDGYSPSSLSSPTG